MDFLIFIGGCGLIYWANEIIRSSQKHQETSPYSSGFVHLAGGVLGMIGALLFIYGGAAMLFSWQK